jgi:hypothetical protein
VASPSTSSTPPDVPADAPVPAATVKVLVPGEHSMVSLLGTNDELLKLVEKAFAADIHVRGNEVTISAGDAAETDRVATLFEELVLLLDRGQTLDKAMVKQTIRMLRSDGDDRPSEVLSEALITHRGRTIRPKTLGQKRYLDAIKANTVTFGIGPAGTGKTYLAMGAAVQALRAKQVNRLILTRPAVEAGERLGFLPGTLHEKIDPYLKPLWDALHDMMEAEELIAHVDRGTIEVAPLAYMRGRAQPVSEPVLTPTGWRPIGELQDRRPGDRLRRATHRGPRRLPAGREGHLPAVGAGWRQHPVHGRPPLVGLDPGGPSPRQAAACRRDAGDGRQPPRRARATLRAPPADRAGGALAPRGADGPLRPRAAPRRRLHHRLDHPLVLHPRPGTGRRARRGVG